MAGVAHTLTIQTTLSVIYSQALQWNRAGSQASLDIRFQTLKRAILSEIAHRG